MTTSETNKAPFSQTQRHSWRINVLYIIATCTCSFHGTLDFGWNCKKYNSKVVNFYSILPNQNSVKMFWKNNIIWRFSTVIIKILGSFQIPQDIVGGRIIQRRGPHAARGPRVWDPWYSSCPITLVRKKVTERRKIAWGLNVKFMSVTIALEPSDGKNMADKNVINSLLHEIICNFNGNTIL